MDWVFDSLTDFLTDWLTDWVFDWLINNWLTARISKWFFWWVWICKCVTRSLSIDRDQLFHSTHCGIRKWLSLLLPKDSWVVHSLMHPCERTLGTRFKEQGSRARDGAVVRALASHQCGPGSNPGIDAISGLSLLFLLSFAPRGFSLGTPVFPSPQKPTFPNSNSTRNQVDDEPLCGCATSKSLLFIYFIIIYLRLSCSCLLQKHQH